MTRRSGRRHPKGWPRLRRFVLDRDGWRCRACGRAARLEVDHVIPVFRRPDLEMDAGNCQTLCRGCHFAKTKQERAKPITPERAAWRELVEEM